eukprot:TRINITY_DN1003_c0_g1_i4.p1 TRINITY_DN1003_c0_g1~~TRINITY_DN1003_c0_g1_i4.p1  ORF type:complete len:530 (-),score=125.00 TRINITY_DN1003_c0_g1_i4:1398-2912(-)
MEFANTIAPMTLKGERGLQASYWKEHTESLSIEAMMLDSQASRLDKEERPEILGMLPDFRGQQILELGAGLGRFTVPLAKEAAHVTAIDFIEKVIMKNKEQNGHLGNIDFKCSDVASRDFQIEPSSKDLIFTNWLLMYLGDDEVSSLAKKMLEGLRYGGHLFFRESCVCQSGDHKRKSNPTHYRDPSFYARLFDNLRIKESDGSISKFHLISCKCVATYVRMKRNQNQVCWLWEKIECKDLMEAEHTFQQFLDSVQYTKTGILRYERVFGYGYVSTGGAETTKEFVELLDLKPGQKVLDVGCGIGGGDFYMAEEFDAEVLGIDLSMNMITIALERAIGLKCAVQFEVADCTTREFTEDHFDVIYSRDCILHIQDKPALFRSFLKWMKPGGKVLISDYCKGKNASSEDFQAYVKQRGYDLHDVETYGKFLEEAGFINVVAQDRTQQFMDILEKELTKTEEEKDTFIKDFSEEDYNAIVNGWRAKQTRCARGEQKWGLFIAQKPLS